MSKPSAPERSWVSEAGPRHLVSALPNPSDHPQWMDSFPIKTNKILERVSARFSAYTPSLKYKVKAKDYHLVNDLEVWKLLVDRYLDREVKHFRVISLDSESIWQDDEKISRYNQLTMLTSEEVKKLKYLVIGTCFPRVVVLDLEKLDQTFPDVLLEWLYDPKVYILGSDMAKDRLDDYKGILINSWIDTRLTSNRNLIN